MAEAILKTKKIAGHLMRHHLPTELRVSHEEERELNNNDVQVALHLPPFFAFPFRERSAAIYSKAHNY
jgi:hypothetical protein